MRISKEHDIRRNEILDKAESLFETIGYNKTTVNDILREVNIAKGTFYYYFKSKEEVLDAIIDRYMEVGLERAEAVRDRKDLNPMQKLLHVFLSMQMGGPDNKVIEELHNPENALMHQKSLTQIVLGLTPVLTDIVKEGLDEGMFHTEFPVQTIQIILAASVTLTDEGIFKFTKEEQLQLMQAIVYSFETLLGAEKGSFAFGLHAFTDRI